MKVSVAMTKRELCELIQRNIAMPDFVTKNARFVVEVDIDRYRSPSEFCTVVFSDTPPEAE